MKAETDSPGLVDFVIGLVNSNTLRQIQNFQQICEDRKPFLKLIKTIHKKYSFEIWLHHWQTRKWLLPPLISHMYLTKLISE